MQIPDFSPKQAWSIRPIKKFKDGTFCTGSPGDCGMPILVETGKNMVGDSSAVDGINFGLKYQLTTNNGIKTTETVGNPCPNGSSSCLNPSKINCPGFGYMRMCSWYSGLFF